MKNLIIEIKKAVLILSLLTGCYEVQELDDCECDECEVCTVEQSIDVGDEWECAGVETPRNRCIDKILVTHETDEKYFLNGRCYFDETREWCEFGCYDPGPGKEPRCYNPCEVNPCETPEPHCESTVFLAEYNQSICALTGDERVFECVPAISNRTYCGCVESDGDRPAHCYGDYDDEN